MGDPIVFPNLWDIRYLGKKKCLLVVLGRLLELAEEDVRIAEIAVRAPFRAPVTKLLRYFQSFLHNSIILSVLRIRIFLSRISYPGSKRFRIRIPIKEFKYC
jgi:hypothetical protein